MRPLRGRVHAVTLLLIVLLFLPLILLFLMPLQSPVAVFWYWVLLIASFIAVWFLFGMGKRTAEAMEPEEALPVAIPDQAQEPAVQEVLDVKTATRQKGVEIYQGSLRLGTQRAFEILKQRLSIAGKMPLLQEAAGGRIDVIVLPQPPEVMAVERSQRLWLHWLLFFVTLGTTTYAGALHRGGDPLSNPNDLWVGVPYAVSLLAILGFHELGHFFMARHHGMKVTPPFFIPVPFGLGTFGAFIQMRSPSENRRALFDVAIAGPLAGLVVALPALLIGLMGSQVVHASSPPSEATAFFTGSQPAQSILLALLAKLSLGGELGPNASLVLSPAAFAGWLGLLITALNLLPIGQLDGGHIAHAMYGRRLGDGIGSVSMWSLFLLAVFVMPALLMWAIIVFLIAGTRDVPPMDDVTPLTPTRKALGFFALLILLAILSPVPLALRHMLGL